MRTAHAHACGTSVKRCPLPPHPPPPPGRCNWSRSCGRRRSRGGRRSRRSRIGPTTQPGRTSPTHRRVCGHWRRGRKCSRRCICGDGGETAIAAQASGAIAVQPRRPAAGAEDATAQASGPRRSRGGSDPSRIEGGRELSPVPAATHAEALAPEFASARTSGAAPPHTSKLPVRSCRHAGRNKAPSQQTQVRLFRTALMVGCWTACFGSRARCRGLA